MKLEILRLFLSCVVLCLYQTQRLEEETYPALGELTSRISTLNLECVRQIKTRLVALSGRVHKVNNTIIVKLKHHVINSNL